LSKVSIIIPVYNVEKYLSECLDSVVNQTLNDLEIICVNDVSPDNSANILNKYALKDKRIKIINHDTNQGLGPARNTGVTNATSPHIAFIDSDDYIDPTMMEKLVNSIESNHAELSWCATAKVTETGKIIDSGSIPEKEWTSEEVFDCEQLYPSIQTVTNKLFKKELIKNIIQLPILIEDEPTIAQYIPKCKKINTLNEPLYFYRHTPESLSNPSFHSPKYWEDFFNDYALYFNILEKNRINTNSIRKQLILRCSALLWRIKTYSLLQSKSWKIQNRTILDFLKSETIPIKKYCPLLFTYLKFTLNINFSFKIKKELINIGLLLSRNIWIKKCSLLAFPFDIIKVELPKIKNLIVKILNNIEFKFYNIIAKLYKYFFTKPIWIIGEREDTAQENGLYFYKYLKLKKPLEKSFYVINKSREQFKNVSQLGSIIHFNSFKHKMLFCAGKYYVTSHNHYCVPKYKFGRGRFPKPTTLTNVFLDHGITYADVSQFYGKENSDIDLFICGAKQEEKYVLENFGYTKNEVSYTGFSRFDSLHEFNKQKQILVMPTWRREIYDIKNKTELQKEKFFKNSKYFKSFQSIFNNKILLTILERFNYQLIFYPHYEIQHYLHHFSSENKQITIASKEEYNVQELLKSSSLLITDTSSVHFDFAYMFKPSIYYRFDKEHFLNSHLPEGYFKFESMGFGEVVETEKELIDIIEKYIESNCKMSQIYSNRVKEFYPLYDTNNCKRIYESIVRLS